LRITIRLSTGLGLLHATPALELEGLGDDADGQDAHLLGDARDHRRGACAGAAAHAGGQEHHVGALDRGADALLGFLGGLAADDGLGAGAEAVVAELQQLVGLGAVQCLGVDEFHALHAFRDHVLDGVAAAAADADDLDLGAKFELFDHLDGHGSLLRVGCSCRLIE